MSQQTLWEQNTMETSTIWEQESSETWEQGKHDIKFRLETQRWQNYATPVFATLTTTLYGTHKFPVADAQGLSFYHYRTLATPSYNNPFLIDMISESLYITI